MLLDRFKNLTYNRKCCLVTFRGSYITKRRFDNYWVFLFSLDNFLVELWYNRIQGRIVGVNAFKDPKGLDLYLEQISIKQVDQILNN